MSKEKYPLRYKLFFWACRKMGYGVHYRNKYGIKQFTITKLTGIDY